MQDRRGDPAGDLERELSAAGGVRARPAATARLRALLLARLQEGRAELDRARSGYDVPVAVAIAVDSGVVVAVTPVEAAVRADATVAAGRAWLLVAATVGALVDLAGMASRHASADLSLIAGAFRDEFLALGVPAAGVTHEAVAELAALALEEQVLGVDRLRARAVAVPTALVEGVADTLRPPIGASHPLRIAEAVARLGGRPADAQSVDEREDAVLELLRPGSAVVARPHDDADPSRRIARRILQRLVGMGKWGGYHTEFAHLSRGFAGNERALAQQVGEALIADGLLLEKPSTGQRHVLLNPRRAADIRELIESGRPPAGLRLP